MGWCTDTGNEIKCNKNSIGSKEKFTVECLQQCEQAQGDANSRCQVSFRNLKVCCTTDPNGISDSDDDPGDDDCKDWENVATGDQSDEFIALLQAVKAPNRVRFNQLAVLRRVMKRKKAFRFAEWMDDNSAAEKQKAQAKWD